MKMEIGRNLPTQSISQLKNEGKTEVTIEPLNQNTQTDQNVLINKEEVQKNVESINKFLNSTTSHLKFTLHEELNEYYVAVIDEQTNEVIREIPPKKLLDIFAAMKETIGLFIDKKI